MYNALHAQKQQHHHALETSAHPSASSVLAQPQPQQQHPSSLRKWPLLPPHNNTPFHSFYSSASAATAASPFSSARNLLDASSTSRRSSSVVYLHHNNINSNTAAGNNSPLLVLPQASVTSPPAPLIHNGSGRNSMLHNGSGRNSITMMPAPPPSSSSSLLLSSSQAAPTAISINPRAVHLREGSSYFRPMTPQQRNQRHNIHVLFLEPLAKTAEEHILNRLTAYIGRKVHKRGFYHTEIVIPDLECSTLSCPSYISSSIYNGETVTLTKTKTFANPGYTVLTITVDGMELSKIADYLYEAKRMQLRFDPIGMYLAVLPFQLNPFASTGQRTFCSKHVTKALKSANIDGIATLNENIVTPSKLYRVMHDQIPRDRMVVGSVLFKQKALLENASLNFSIQ